MREASTSKIEQLIDEIEEFIESCKPQPFSQSKVIVPKDELYELLTELRLKTPEEIKRYQKIISNREKIIGDAQAQAEKMVEETNVYVNQLVEEHQIMVKAYERAEEVINSANAQAEQTVNAANEDAENIRRSALEYTAEIIDNLQSVIGRTLDVARTNYDGILNGLSYNLDVLTSNREALQQQLAAPVEIPEYEPRQSSIPAPSVDEIPAQQLQAEVPADTAEDDDVDFDDVDDYDDID
ncbi:MAG: ATPase [Clostridiales bacterium]|nr:ATPase [Clostridiales bacterium]MDY3745548.1 ATPase [Lachnospiraceae bacterium]